MSLQMLFIIGAPRSGTTMLERMLASHSMIQGGPEPHLLTPLAHLGPWANVDKAPYDHILAAEAQRMFIEQLPRKEQDYWDACRAYCDVLYTRYAAANGGKPICLDKTPAYALILPFMMNVFPDAKYVVITRHPLAMFSSFANSFFDGDYARAHEYNPIILRYVPALANFLRQQEVPFLHVRYEDLVAGPEEYFDRICRYLGVPFEQGAVDYGKNKDAHPQGGLGDPIGVHQHTRPKTGSVKKWARELAAEPAKLKLMRTIIAQVDPEDLQVMGYPLSELWDPLNELEGKPVRVPKPAPLDRYRIQRKMIVYGRSLTRQVPVLRKMLLRARLAADVLLRE
jgi:hypothetical protein